MISVYNNNNSRCGRYSIFRHRLLDEYNSDEHELTSHYTDAAEFT